MHIVSYDPTQNMLACRKKMICIFRLTCYKSFIPHGVKDSSLRLYYCHHKRGRKGKKQLLTIVDALADQWLREAAASWWFTSLVDVGEKSRSLSSKF